MLENQPITEERAENAVTAALARTMRNTSFYSLEHPMVRLSLEETKEKIERLLEKKREFVLKIVEGELIADDKPLIDSSSGTANLVGACLRRGIESITFVRGVSCEEIAVFVDLLAREPESIEAEGSAAEVLGRAGVNFIKAEKLLAPERGDTEMVVEKRRKNYASAIDILRATARRARMGVSPEGGPAHKVVGELVDSIIYEQSAMLGMVSVKGRDEYTFTHALHICILCLELGNSLGLSRDHLQELGVCAMLHDIGKIFVPLSVLRKPTTLTPKEFAIIEQHPTHGALLLCRHENAPAMAPLVAFEHHLHYDFSGYPRGTRRRELNFYSLLVGPADVYDALTTDRPYRPALTPQQALEVMHAQAEHFEPRILARFTEMLGKYPAGSLLRLSDGNMAVVTRPNPHNPEAPRVRLLQVDEEEYHLCEEEIDLSFKDPLTAKMRFSIEEVLDPMGMNLDVNKLMGGTLYCTE